MGGGKECLCVRQYKAALSLFRLIIFISCRIFLSFTFSVSQQY